VWPLAAEVIFLLSATELAATPLHSFEGITLPLSVLAVEGVQRWGFGRLRHRVLIGVVAVAAFTIPTTYWELRNAKTLAAPTPGNANFITESEQDALQYLAADRTPGGVFTRFYLGAIVPAETGRRTFVGNCLWSEPGCSWRSIVAQQLLDGTVPPPQAQGIINQIGARFVLTDCTTPLSVGRMLARISSSVRTFGCASVYELSAPGPPEGALAESQLNAALRSPGRD
jgi:hypothetical protein